MTEAFLVGGVRTPTNELLTAAICWAAIGVLWVLINRTQTGKALLECINRRLAAEVRG